MTALTVITPGVQSTLQGAPRAGFRHQGVPRSGPADPISHGLANRAVGNLPSATAIEITLGRAAFRAGKPVTIALVGGLADLRVEGSPRPVGTPIRLDEGEVIDIGPLTAGCRIYLAGRGGFVAETFLGSASTYLPAGFGGHDGRSLAGEDVLELSDDTSDLDPSPVPEGLSPFVSDQWVLRVIPGPDAHLMPDRAARRFYNEPFAIGRRANRMGMALEGNPVDIREHTGLKSAPVFPGTVQCPPGGVPFLLSVDAQTTGGYPRVAQVIRADRHRMGQCAPGDRLTFVAVDRETAHQALADKRAALAAYAGAPLI